MSNELPATVKRIATALEVIAARLGEIAQILEDRF